MKRAAALLLILWTASSYGADPADSTGFTRRELRITNRRWISHMAYERCAPNHCITLLATHPGIWAWHSDSFPLKYICPGPVECMELIQRIDAHLTSGENLSLVVEGGFVREIILLQRGQ